MTREQLEQMLADAHQPTIPTTFWLPIEVLGMDEDSEKARETVLSAGTEHTYGTPFRVDVPAYTGQEPSRVELYTQELKRLFPAAIVFERQGSKVYGKARAVDSDLIVEIRLLSPYVSVGVFNEKFDVVSEMMTSPTEAVANLRDKLNDIKNSCALITRYLDSKLGK